MCTSLVTINHHGGPEVVVLDTVDLADIGPGEMQMRQAAVGLNFMNICQWSGSYQIPLPRSLGLEATTFALIRNGVLRVNINQRMPLSDAAAHAAIETGNTTRSTVLIP